MQPSSPESTRTKARRIRTRAVLAVIAAVVAVALAIGFVIAPSVQRALAQPNIRMISSGGTVWFCRTDSMGPIPPQFYRFDFRLQNTGDADGYAKVDFFVSLNEVGRGIYVVPAGHAVDGNATFEVDICDFFPAGGSPILHSFWKA